MASKKESASFEALYQQLEEAVSALEDGGLTLNESIALYEDGIKLAKHCQEFLQQAELRVTKLQETLIQVPSMLREEAVEYAPEVEAEVSQDPLLLE